MKVRLFLHLNLLAVAPLWIIMASSMASELTRPGERPVGTAVPVELVQDSGRYQLLRGGLPYRIRGAGMESGEIDVFAAHGGNSLRTWRTDSDSSTGIEFLDQAAKYGVTVALCIELGSERHGFDYDDAEAVARQLEYARGEVMKYKDHPALLLWIIGNELNHSFTNPAVFDAINDISGMIHTVDGNHPTTTALSGFGADLVDLAQQRAPDLDFLSFQLYAGLDELPQKLEKTAYNRPFMITEWGTTGHWEVATTTWGAPVELHSSEKARRYLQRYQQVIAPHSGQIIGSYVFLWGQKQERTPTWYGMLLEDGSRTESMDVMHYIWSGQWPQSRSPHVKGMWLNSKSADQNVVLRAGLAYSARLDAEDSEGDELSYRWLVMRESEATQQGGDPEAVPETVEGLIEIREDGYIALKAPAEPGAYRLFAQVYDGSGLAGYANIPFMVESAPH